MTSMHLLEIGIVIVVFAGLFYWLFVAAPRANARRREELMARRAAQQAWDPASRNR